MSDPSKEVKSSTKSWLETQEGKDLLEKVRKQNETSLSRAKERGLADDFAPSSI